MTTLKISTRITIDGDDGDATNSDHSWLKEKTFTLTEHLGPLKILPTSETLTIWDPSSHPIADFDVLVIWADAAVEIELTCNNGDAAEAVFTLPLAADVPLVLGADDSRYNDGSFSGTLDVIDLIRVKESNGAAAKVYVFLGT